MQTKQSIACLDAEPSDELTKLRLLVRFNKFVATRHVLLRRNQPTLRAIQLHYGPNLTEFQIQKSVCSDLFRDFNLLFIHSFSEMDAVARQNKSNSMGFSHLHCCWLYCWNADWQTVVLNLVQQSVCKGRWRCKSEHLALFESKNGDDSLHRRVPNVRS